MAKNISCFLIRKLGSNYVSTPRPTSINGMVRSWSSMAPRIGKQQETVQVQPPHSAADENEKAIVSSYWGIAPPKVSKKDGSPWRWNCFRPWEVYKADTTTDVKKHHEPTTYTDKFAFWTVQALKYPTHSSRNGTCAMQCYEKQ